MICNRKKKLVCLTLIFLAGSCANKNSIGPESQAQWEKVNGLNTSTVQSIAVSKTSPQKMMAGTLDGIYASDNGGNTWRRVGSDLASQDAKCVQIDPKDAERVYLGTWGRGVYKSDDFGNSWQSAWPSEADPRITCLLIMPESSDVIWAGTDNGLYKSMNKGSSWQTITQIGKVTAIATDPSNPLHVLIGVHTKGCYSSADGGTSWKAVNAGFFQSSDGIASPNAILFDPVNPATVFCSTGWVDLYKSIDGGASWMHIADDLTEKKIVSIALDPDFPQRMWAASAKYGVFKSENGGESWEPINEGLETLLIKSITFAKNKQALIFLGTIGNGIYRTVDAEQ